MYERKITMTLGTRIIPHGEISAKPLSGIDSISLHISLWDNKNKEKMLNKIIVFLEKELTNNGYTLFRPEELSSLTTRPTFKKK